MATAALSTAKPAHVPDGLVFDLDIYDLPGLVDGLTDDVHRLWKVIQDSHPDIFWTLRNGGHWFATRYDVIQRAGVDAKRFSNSDIFVPQGNAPFLTPTNMDPPEHGGFRKRLMPTFSPTMLAQAADEARAAAVSLIDKTKPKGHCEFISELSTIMPVVAFMTLVNLPLGDLDHLRSVAGKFAPGNPDSDAPWAELSRYVQDHIDRRREEPRDDSCHPSSRRKSPASR